MREFQIGIIGVGTVAATHVKAVAALPSEKPLAITRYVAAQSIAVCSIVH